MTGYEGFNAMKELVTAVILFLLCQYPILAAENGRSDGTFLDDAVFWDEEQISTATKFSIPMRRAPAIATIITDDEIRDTGARDLADVLNRVPGLAVHQNWIGVKTVEVRGINSHNTEKLLFMMNGHRLNAPFFVLVTCVFDDPSPDPASALDPLPSDMPRDGRQIMVEASYYFE